MKDVDSNKTNQGNTANLPEEDFDFSELQGLSCGPDGCSIPQDYYKGKTKNNTAEDDND